mgnify:CR=1 FL=1
MERGIALDLKTTAGRDALDRLIDGADVRTIPLDVLRSNIGYVQQETFLFSDSIADNISACAKVVQTRLKRNRSDSMPQN